MTTGGWGKRHTALLASVAIFGSFAGVAGVVAQTPPAAPLEIEGSIRTEFEIDDNGGLRNESPGNDTSIVNELELSIVSNTPTQRVSLAFGADVQFEDKARGQEDKGVEDPFVRLSYRLDGPDSRLTFNGTFRTDDFIDSVFLDTDDDLVEDTVFTSDGDVDRLNLSFAYSFGLNAPIGLDFFARRSERSFTNVVNPDLFDRTEDNYGVTGRFRINPAATARVIWRETRFSAEDSLQTERDTTNIGLGLAYEIRPDLTFDGEITQTSIEQQTTGATRETDGVSGSLSLTRELSNGNIGIVAEQEQFTGTVRSELQVVRNLVLPQGAFSFGAGVSTSDTGDDALVGSVSYANELPTGSLTAELTRTATVNDSNEEVARTELAVDYNYEINPVSGLIFGLDIANVDDAGTGVTNDTTRTDFSVTYRRQLTRDWDWRFGYEGRFENRGDNTARSNAIVTSIGRSFSIRP